MPTYCSSSDVQRYVPTGDLSTTQINSFIDENEADMEKLIGTQSASDDAVKKLATLMTARTILTTTPIIFSMLGSREDWTPVLASWDAEIRRLVKMYRGAKVQQSAYEHIDETDRYEEELPEE